MDLTTEHGRAQAIAGGGEAGRLALIVEGALDNHTSHRETVCWHLLQEIQVPETNDLTGQLEQVHYALRHGGEEELVAAVKLCNEIFKHLDVLEAELLDVTRRIREASEVLEGK